MPPSPSLERILYGPRTCPVTGRPCELVYRRAEVPHRRSIQPLGSTNSCRPITHLIMKCYLGTRYARKVLLRRLTSDLTQQLTAFADESAVREETRASLSLRTFIPHPFPSSAARAS